MGVGFHDLLLGSTDLLEWLPVFLAREILLTLPGILCKDMTKDAEERARGRGAEGEVCGEGCGAPMVSPVCHSAGPSRVRQQGSSQEDGGFITEA